MDAVEKGLSDEGAGEPLVTLGNYGAVDAAWPLDLEEERLSDAGHKSSYAGQSPTRRRKPVTRSAPNLSLCDLQSTRETRGGVSCTAPTMASGTKKPRQSRGWGFDRLLAEDRQQVPGVFLLDDENVLQSAA